MPDTTRASFTASPLTLAAGQSATVYLALQNRSDRVQSYLIEISGAAAAWAAPDQAQVSAFPRQELRLELTVTAPPDVPAGVTSLRAEVTDEREGGVVAQATLEVQVLGPAVAEPAPSPATTPAAAEPTPTTSPSEEAPTSPSAATQPTPPHADADADTQPTPPRADANAATQPTTTRADAARPDEAARANDAVRADDPATGGYTAVRLTVTPVPGSDPGAPPREWALTLANVGKRLDAFGFRVTDLRSDWYTIEPQEVSLKEDETVAGPDGPRLKLTPPLDAPAGEYPFTLIARSLMDPRASDKQLLTLVILPRGQAAWSVLARPGDTQGQARFELELASDAASNINQDVTLTAEVKPAGCAVRFQPETVRLFARQKARLSLVVTPERYLKPGERKQFDIEVRADVDRGQPPAPLKLQVAQVGTPPPGIRLPVAEKADRLKADYKVEVTNMADVEVTYQFRVTAQEAGCTYVCNPPSLTVPAKERGETTLTATAQTVSEGGDKTYRFTVEALFKGESVAAASAGGVFRQVYRDPVLLKLIPDRPIESRGRVGFTVRTVNQLPSPVRVTLEPLDEQAALDFHPRECELTLRPGEEMDTRFKARCKESLKVGRRNHDYTVRGRAEGISTLATAKGRIVQRPPRIATEVWLRLAALLLVVAALWFGLHLVDQFAQASPTAQVQGVPVGQVAQVIARAPLVRNLLEAHYPFYERWPMLDPNTQFHNLAYFLVNDALDSLRSQFTAPARR